MELPPLLLTHKRNSKSIVWQYFGLECNEDGNLKDRDMAVCNICLKRISAKGGNTSNLFQHVGVHHPQEYAKIRDKKLTCYNGTSRMKELPMVPKEETRKFIEVSPAPASRTVKRKLASPGAQEIYQPTAQASTSTMAKSDSYPKDSPKHSRMTEIVSYFLAKELVPAEIVDRKGFQQLLQTFDVRYCLPDSGHFKGNMFPGFYSGLRSTVAQEVSMMSFFSATIDILPSYGCGYYIVFSVHFIDDEWVLKNRCLVSMYVPPGQTIQATADGLVSLLMQWNLPPEKLTCVITKESEDLVKVLEYMGWPQLPCFGSRLHFAIKSAFEENNKASKAVNDCRFLGASFMQNDEKKKELLKAKEELGLSDQKLKVDHSGKWQATQEMISSILHLEPAILKVCANLEPLLDSFPSFKAVNEALEPITEITDILTSEYYVTLSSVKPLLHLLTTSVLSVSEDDKELTNEMRRRIAETIVASYQEYRCQVVLNIATYLDPRFKSLFSNESEAENVAELIVTEGMENFSTTNCMDKEDENTALNRGVKVKLEEPSQKKRKSLGKLLEQLKTVTEVEKPPAGSVIRKELDSYLTAPKPDSESNPLDWWKTQCNNYPNLAVLARKYLSVCATSSPSEYLFNEKEESSFLQGMLKDPEEVNIAIFLARNLCSNPQPAKYGNKKD